MSAIVMGKSALPVSRMRAGWRKREGWMAEFDTQLSELLKGALTEEGGTLAAPVFNALADDFTKLLSRGGAHRVGVRWCTVTEGNLHRHLFTLRCPDQAFFLDGIKVYLSRHNLHPLAQQTVVACATHDQAGRVTSLCPADICATGNEMLIALHFSATLVPDGEALYRDLAAIVRAVQVSVADFSRMAEMVLHAGQHLAHDLPEVSALLSWMRDGKYILLGARIDGEKLGIMTDPHTLKQVTPGLSDDLAGVATPTVPGIEWLYLPHGRDFLYGTTHLETVRITWREREGLASALLLGYFSRSARHTNASQVPYISRIWTRLQDRPELARSAYLTREARTLFDRIPKQVLLSVPEDELLPMLLSVIKMGAPERSGVFLLTPHPGRVRLVVAVVATERFDRSVRDGILTAVESAGMEVLSHKPVAVGTNLLLFVSTRADGITEEDLGNLKEAVHESVITWRDRARAAVRSALPGPELPGAIEVLTTVPRLYTELFPAETFVSDLAIMGRVRADSLPHVRLETVTDGVDLHIFTAFPVPLGSLVRIVQRFDLSALKEVVVDFPGNPPVHLTTLHCGYRRTIHTDALPRLKDALEAVLRDLSDNDPINALVLSGELAINQVEVLASLRDHLVQIVADASGHTITETLKAHPSVTRALYRLFAARHQSKGGDEEAARSHFSQRLGTVQSLADDRWFRALADLVVAGVRSNAYTRKVGEPIAIKIRPELLDFAPAPRPYREIFVHGRHLEGVHLRFGPIARGGLRLSDRRDDFRTEVLELAATQQVKNSIIVPAGAKGGFVLKGGAGTAFAQDQYRAFIRALLSVTDNLKGERTVPPPGVRVAEEDADDPYLVVAADKGTATFSDLANGEARTAGFWLDDAFASGGSNGYDHKVYGITARGAWVSVCHHFESLGKNPEKDPVTAIGIGDMGGDVFGNGFLLSQTLHLVAAFNHKHIFLDPTPDPSSAYRERKRLFDQVAGWDAYNSDLISPGGGVFERATKAIPVGPEAARALGIKAGEWNGEALVQAILKAPVDLLYNGGIGTYVKAEAERHEDVRDPVNNAVRVNASALRCRVVGEGGNLGFTQAARIEFAARGGLINTDAVDNSGGVNMSDHEVNLKILLARTPNPPSTAVRNRLLSGVGDEVAALCLASNLAQARTLTLASHMAKHFASRATALRDRLVTEGQLDPATHPSIMDDEADLSLPPQLAVLMGCEKNRQTAALAEGGFARSSPFAGDLLTGYFPKRVATRFKDGIRNHPLADPIVHTVAAGRLVDGAGLFSVSHLEDLVDGASTTDAAHALLGAEFILDTAQITEAIWRDVKELGTRVALHNELRLHIQRFAEEMLRLCPVGDLALDCLKERRQAAAGFRKRLVDTPESAFRFPQPTRDSGLGEAAQAWLNALPLLSRSGVAMHVSSRLDMPLARCLAAGRATLKALPFPHAEAALRRPEWGAPGRQAVRREWLHRLALMRARAVESLIAQGGRDPEKAARTLWERHRHHQALVALAEQLRGETDPDPMQVVLLLTRLESLIDETG
ncbi:MAG: NAD-glutamate dehydrogenase domain-containing protein [Leptospirillia bacterium]